MPPIRRTALIDGATKEGQTIVIEANRQGMHALQAGSVGLEFARDMGTSADNSQILGLTIDNFPGDGILLNNVANVRIGSKSVGGMTSYGSMTITRNGLNPAPMTSSAGITIAGAMAKNNTIVASYIGTNASSEAGKGNGRGILIDNGASGNTIGGLDPAERNIISGNTGAGGTGILIYNSDNNTVIGNYIGTNKDATAKLPNSNGGVGIGGTSKDNTIGGIVATKNGIIVTPANIISGNNRDGINIYDSASNNKVYGNFIGVGFDKDGKVVGLGNSWSGIWFSPAQASGNKIGGPQAGALNVISSNGEHGIGFNNSNNNRVENNNIGIGPDPNDLTVMLGNGQNGVTFSGTSRGNEIKGTRNHNNKSGKAYAGNAKQNKIFDPNSTSGNAYGIDNGDLEGTPVITSAVVSGTTITITGTLNHTPNSQFVLEFFGNRVAERQGERFLGNLTVTTNSSGVASFVATFNTIYGSYVTATSTGTASDGFTSEFSTDVPITGLSSLAAVGDFVWQDLNRNGLQDPGEPGLAGVLVQLFQVGGLYSAEATTDINGHYLFTNVPVGQYFIQFLPPSGFDFTLPYQGDETLDSNADPLDGTTANFTLIAGQVNPTFDAGLVTVLGGAPRRYRGPRR